MLENELSDAVKEVKNPERRINLIAALVICSVLWAILVLVVRSWGTDLLEENKSLKIENNTIKGYMQHQIDSIKFVQYQDVVDQLNQIKKLTKYQDSLNTALANIKHDLK